jgi:hypothetical protein
VNGNASKNDDLVLNSEDLVHSYDEACSDLCQSTPVSKVIDKLTEGYGKIKALKKILRLALEDRSPPYESKSNTAYKKNVVDFCARPDLAYNLGTHCGRHCSDDWNVAVITASMAPEKHSQVILDIIDGEIALGSEKKPTLLIAAVRAPGLGVNGLQGVNYAVIFALPFEESLIRQAFCRVCRSGQVSKCLVSMDTGMEEQIVRRHSNRENSFNEATGKVATGMVATSKD